MKKFITLFFVALSIVISSTAQDAKPVQFSFAAVRVNDSMAYLSVKAKIKKGYALFSVKKTNPDDAFVSALAVDSSHYQRKGDTATEIGKLQLVKEDGGAGVYHLYSDTVEFRFPLHIPATDKGQLKGSFTWLAKSGDQFPSNTESFFCKDP